VALFALKKEGQAFCMQVHNAQRYKYGAVGYKQYPGELPRVEQTANNECLPLLFYWKKEDYFDTLPSRLPDVNILLNQVRDSDSATFFVQTPISRTLRPGYDLLRFCWDWTQKTSIYFLPGQSEQGPEWQWRPIALKLKRGKNGFFELHARFEGGGKIDVEQTAYKYLYHHKKGEFYRLKIAPKMASGVVFEGTEPATRDFEVEIEVLGELEFALKVAWGGGEGVSESGFWYLVVSQYWTTQGIGVMRSKFKMLAAREFPDGVPQEGRFRLGSILPA
jgi:hypothetical protein